MDFYSGFVYDMLGIPVELYTAMFAIARVVGWSAHRIEEMICADKIIRPAYMSVMEEKIIVGEICNSVCIYAIIKSNSYTMLPYSKEKGGRFWHLLSKRQAMILLIVPHSFRNMDFSILGLEEGEKTV